MGEGLERERGTFGGGRERGSKENGGTGEGREDDHPILCGHFPPGKRQWGRRSAGREKGGEGERREVKQCGGEIILQASFVLMSKILNATTRDRERSRERGRSFDSERGSAEGSLALVSRKERGGGPSWWKKIALLEERRGEGRLVKSSAGRVQSFFFIKQGHTSQDSQWGSGESDTGILLGTHKCWCRYYVVR